MKSSGDWYPTYTMELTPRFDLPKEVEILLFGNEASGSASGLRAHWSKLDKTDREAVVAYCEELDCLHDDLQFILEEMDQSIRILYAEHLNLKRLALVYHIDNFYFRIHTYREKVFRLVNHFCSLGLDAGGAFNRRVMVALRSRGLKSLMRVLSWFDRGRMLADAIDLRHLLVHAIARREWPTMRTGRRLDDRMLAKGEIYVLDRVTDLDRLYESRQRKLGRIYSRLERFRTDVVAALKAATRSGKA